MSVYKKVRLTISLTPKTIGRLRAVHSTVAGFASVSDIVDQLVSSPDFYRFYKRRVSRDETVTRSRDWTDCEVKALAKGIAMGIRKRKTRRGNYQEDTETSRKYIIARAIRDFLKGEYPRPSDLKRVQKHLMQLGFKEGTTVQNISMQLSRGELLQGLTQKTKDGWVYIPECVEEER